MKVLTCVLVSVVTCYGSMSASAVVSQPIPGGPSVELRPDNSQRPRPLSATVFHNPVNRAHLESTGQTVPQPYQIHDDLFSQNRSSVSTHISREGTDKAPLVDQLQQQLSMKEKEVSALREKTAAATEHVNAEKHRVGALETQLSQREQDLKIIFRDRNEPQSQAPQDISSTKSDLEQAKQRIEALERELTFSNLDYAKRRIIELERQLDAKEKELTTLRSTASDSSKSKVELASQTEELNQTKRRIEELEQQLTGKEQELAAVKDNLNHVTQKLSDLDPQAKTAARNAELSQAKQLLADLERSSSKSGELPPVQAPSSPERVPSNPPPSDKTDTPTAGSSLAKINESLTNVLQQELKSGSVSLRKRGDTLILALSSGELFAPGDATITASGTSLIERIGTTLHQFRYRSIEVAGHTDNKPVRSDPRRAFHDNVQLSQARAEHASQALINSGLEADRIKAVGYAATKPIASNDSEKGRSKNRRVEIIVTPLSESPTVSQESGKHASKKHGVASHPRRVLERVTTR